MPDKQDLARLQMLLMEQQQTIDQYSDLIRDQQNQLDLLRQRIALLEQKISQHDQSINPGQGQQHEPPPHY